MKERTPPMRNEHANDSRLRFLFDNGVVGFALAADATVGEVARMWDDVSRWHVGHAVGIDVTVAAELGNLASTFHEAAPDVQDLRNAASATGRQTCYVAGSGRASSVPPAIRALR